MKNIIIIDDDPVICSLLKSFLSLKKYNVKCFSHLDEALAAIVKEPFDLALTDMKLSDIVGDKIIKKLLEANPELKLIAMSGDTSFDKLQADLKMTLPFLRKPFRLQEVEKIILSLSNESTGA